MLAAIRGVSFNAQLGPFETFAELQAAGSRELPGLAWNPVVNIKVEFTKLGSFSYTSTEAASEPEPRAATPPYTFPKPVATQEPDAIVCLPSL
jgi:hypothetical protein